MNIASFAEMVAITALSLFVMEGILQLVANLVPIFVGALAVTVFLNGFFVSVMGLIQPPSDLPIYIRWAH